jgi:beta-alanine degradation protein BauB
MRRLLLLIALGVVAAPVLAQDLLPADPKHVKVDFENAQVRVLRITLGPHERVPMHYHPSSVTVWLTDSHTRSVIPDGMVQERNFKAGEVAFATASTHMDENLSDQPLEVVWVEIKPQFQRAWGFYEPKGGAPAPAPGAPPAGTAPSPGTAPAPQTPAQPPQN